MGSAALILLKWIRVAAFISLLLGMLAILYEAAIPYYWYRGAMGIFGVGSGIAGFFAINRGTLDWANIFYQSHALFTLILCVGNSGVIIWSRHVYNKYCSIDPPNQAHYDCDQLKIEMMAAIFLIIFSIVILGPLTYIVKKFTRAIEIEGPLNISLPQTTSATNPIST